MDVEKKGKRKFLLWWVFRRISNIPSGEMIKCIDRNSSLKKEVDSMDHPRRKKSEIRPDFGAIINQSERRRKTARINFLTHNFRQRFFSPNREVASAFEILINLQRMERSLWSTAFVMHSKDGKLEIAPSRISANRFRGAIAKRDSASS